MLILPNADASDSPEEFPCHGTTRDVISVSRNAKLIVSDYRYGRQRHFNIVTIRISVVSDLAMIKENLDCLQIFYCCIV